VKFQTNSETDVVLIIDGVSFHCHRDVLSRQSQYFQAMFSRNFAEKNKDVIELKEVDSVAMNAVLSAVYSDELPITVENSLNLLQTASMLQFHQVEKQCIDFLSRSMNPELSLRIYQIADRLSIKSLYYEARCCALWEFSSLKSTEAFFDLPLNYLKSYLSSDLLRSSSEVQVFEAVISWVEAGAYGEGKNETRIEFLPELLHCIRFTTVHADDIQSFLLHPTVSCHQKTSAIIKCILLLLERNAKKDQSSTDEDILKTSVEQNAMLKDGMEQFDEETMTIARQMLSSPPREPPQVPCVVGHIGYPKNDAPSQNEVSSGPCNKKKARNEDSPVDVRPYLMYLVETVDENGKKITQLKPFLSLSKVIYCTKEVSGYRVTSIGKDVIVLGGQRNFGYGRCNNYMWRFRNFGEPGVGEWSKEAILPNPRSYPSVCTLDNHLYLIGGFGRQGSVLKTMERYHIPTGKFFTKLMRFNARHMLNCKKEYSEKNVCTLETVGNFRNKALNTCIVGHKIYSFALSGDWHGYEDEPPSSDDSKSIFEIETYDIMTETFEVVWSGSPDRIKLDDG
ncbi:hypothetical protein J437_LFUL013316, partial [Ladona fulva]